MSSIVICGGSVVGLSTAMMLARDGHDVTVLESDVAEAPGSPEEAWSRWDRHGVPQFHPPHNLFPAFREVADQELPGLTERLLAAGCVWVDYLATAPPTLGDRNPRPGDDRLRFVTGRRPVVESVVAAAAANTPGVHTPRRGGVRPAHRPAGATRRTARGRRRDRRRRADHREPRRGRHGTTLPAERWLTAIGARPPLIESQDSGCVYHTRYFRGPRRPRRHAPTNSPVGSVNVITLDSDNDTWSVTVFGATHDVPLKALRSTEVFDRVLRAFPAHAHWLDGTPISDMVVMAGILDRYRRFVVGGVPVATGLTAVGRRLGLHQPVSRARPVDGADPCGKLRRTVAARLDDPAALARTWDDATEQAVTPFYRGQIAADRARLAQMDALRHHRSPARPDDDTLRFMQAAMHDPDVFRAMLEMVFCLASPQEVMDRPVVRAAVQRAPAEPMPAVPGPDRTRLEDLLAG